MDITKLTTEELENLRNEINDEIRERRRTRQQEVILHFKEAFKALENEHIAVYYYCTECGSTAGLYLNNIFFEEA